MRDAGGGAGSATGPHRSHMDASADLEIGKKLNALCRGGFLRQLDQ